MSVEGAGLSEMGGGGGFVSATLLYITSGHSTNRDIHGEHEKVESFKLLFVLLPIFR